MPTKVQTAELGATWEAAYSRATPFSAKYLLLGSAIRSYFTPASPVHTLQAIALHHLLRLPAAHSGGATKDERFAKLGQFFLLAAQLIQGDVFGIGDGAGFKLGSCAHVHDYCASLEEILNLRSFSGEEFG